MTDFQVTLLLALAVGIILGFIFQRGQFCMTLMLTESTLFRNHRRLTGLILAVLVSVILFNISVSLGLRDRLNLLKSIDVDPAFFQAPLVIERSLVGGLVFGIGMILAGGCVAGILFRIGEGQLSSAISFLGLMAGFGLAMTLEVLGILGPEVSLSTSGTLLPQILQVSSAPLVILAAAFLLAILAALYRGGRIILVIIMFMLSIALATVLYYERTQIVQPTAPPLQLTGDQIEIDRFINDFHVTVSNRSSSKAVSFFTNDAVMVPPGGTILRNASMIKRYYEEEFTRYHQYIVYGRPSRIEVIDGRATAIYSSGLRAWTLGATQPPYIPYRETFTLIRQGDSWKIESLVMTARGAE
ncbi:YeeE/YedE family protein [Candidatus Bathyarchaeota archaeon]|nr:YeeE/YedE family protein [Candidatus Bathyarchaeota archaeon]